MSKSTVTSIRQLVMKKIRDSAEGQLHKIRWYQRQQGGTVTGLQTWCEKWVTDTKPGAETAVGQETKGVGEGGTRTHEHHSRLCRNEKQLMPCYFLFCSTFLLCTGPHELSALLTLPSSGLQKVRCA